MKFLIVSALLAGWGCGDIPEVIDAKNDASGDDAAIDSPVAAGPVRVTVLTTDRTGAPDTTARVLFQDPQGVLVLDATVDPQGKAEAMLPLGGAVTVIRVVLDTATTHNAVLTTVTDVKPGDDLVIGLKRRALTNDQGGATQMSVNYTAVTGATYYQFFYECGSGGVVQTPPPNPLPFRDSCHGATFDLLATAGGVNPPQFSYLAGVTHTNGGSFTIPFGFTPMTNFTVTAMNTPADVTSMSSSRWTMVQNYAAARQNGSISGDPPAGTVSMVMPYPQGVGTRSQVEILFNSPNGTMQHQMHTATLASSVTVDLAQHELPVLTSLGTTRTGATWTATVPGDAPDGQLLLWSGDWTVGAQAFDVLWYVIGPASLTGQALPRLPAEVAKYDPAAQTTVAVSRAILYMTDYDVVDGYDGFRQMAETLLETPFEAKGAFVGMPHQRRLMTHLVPVR